MMHPHSYLGPPTSQQRLVLARIIEATGEKSIRVEETLTRCGTPLRRRLACSLEIEVNDWSAYRPIQTAATITISLDYRNRIRNTYK